MFKTDEELIVFLSLQLRLTLFKKLVVRPLVLFRYFFDIMRGIGSF